MTAPSTGPPRITGGAANASRPLLRRIGTSPAPHSWTTKSSAFTLKRTKRERLHCLCCVANSQAAFVAAANSPAAIAATTVEVLNSSRRPFSVRERREQNQRRNNEQGVGGKDERDPERRQPNVFA